MVLREAYSPAIAGLAHKQTAPVSGFARSFLTSNPISDATITILENGYQFTTDNNGRFGPFQWPVGESITLILEKKGYQTTQTATIVVPPEGLDKPLANISFQVPSNFAVTLFSYAMWVTIDKNACQVTATITAHNKTLDDIPQGEPGAVAILSPDPQVKPFYFSIFENGPLKDKTNPFNHTLIETSDDGGVAFVNVPPSDHPYTLLAVKAGVTFSEVKFIARKGAFINLSPPRGPMVQLSRQDNPTKKAKQTISTEVESDKK